MPTCIPSRLLRELLLIFRYSSFVRVVKAVLGRVVSMLWEAESHWRAGRWWRGGSRVWRRLRSRVSSSSFVQSDSPCVCGLRML